jgi:hypothetical protein
MQLRPAAAATVGEVYGMTLVQAGIPTTCCPSGIPATIPIFVQAASAPNGYLVGLSWTMTWVSAFSQWTGSINTAHGLLESVLQCDGALGWKLQFQVSCTLNAHTPSTCGAQTYNTIVTTPLGAGTITVIVNGGSPPPPTLIFDQMTDADHTALPAHTIAPTNFPGTHWTDQNAGFEINNNKANPTGVYNLAPNAIATVDAGQADVTVSVDVVMVDTNNTDSGVVCRYVDNNNFWIATLSLTGQTFSIYQRLAGAFVLRAQVAKVVTPGTTYNVSMQVAANVLTATVDGGSTINFTSSDFSSSTVHGIRTANDLSVSTNTFDNFKITHP